MQGFEWFELERKREFNLIQTTTIVETFTDTILCQFKSWFIPSLRLEKPKTWRKKNSDNCEQENSKIVQNKKKLWPQVKH